MENSTPCKIVTPEDFILKFGTRDYVEEVTYYTIFDVDRFTEVFWHSGALQIGLLLLLLLFNGASPQIGEI